MIVIHLLYGLEVDDTLQFGLVFIWVKTMREKIKLNKNAMNRFFLIKLFYRSALLFIKKRVHLPVPICSISITQWVGCDLFYMSKYMKDIGIKNMRSLFKSFAAGIKQAHKVEVNSSTQSKSPKSIVCLNLTLSATQYKQLIWQTFLFATWRKLTSLFGLILIS